MLVLMLLVVEKKFCIVDEVEFHLLDLRGRFVGSWSCQRDHCSNSETMVVIVWAMLVLLNNKKDKFQLLITIQLFDESFSITSNTII